MTLYRETGRLTVPVAVAVETLSQIYGSPKRTDTSTTWTAHQGRLFHYELQVDRDSGRFTADVTTALPYRTIVVLSILATLAGRVGYPNSPIIYLVGLWTLLVGLVPILPVLPGLRTAVLPVDNTVTVENRHPSRLGLPAIAVGFLSQVPLFDMPVVQVLFASLAGISLAVYAQHSRPESVSNLRQFTLYVLPAVGLLPLILSLGNLFAVAWLASLQSRWVTTGAVIAICIQTVLVWVFYCRMCEQGLRTVTTIPLQPLRSSRLRALWIGFYGAVNLVVFGTAGFVMYDLMGMISPTATPSSQLTPIAATVRVLSRPVQDVPDLGAAIIVGGLLLVLVSPGLYLLASWSYNAVSTLRSFARLLRELAPVPAADLGFDPGFPVYQLPTARPVASAIALPGLGRGILLSTRTIAELEREELQAVCAHEAYHLTQNDAQTLLFATVSPLGIGGRNGLLALYDLPEAEAAADQEAARVVGIEPTIRALRRMDALQSSAVAFDPKSFDTVPARESGSASQSVASTWPGYFASVTEALDTLRAPYRLLFGNALLAAAHRSTDERIRTLTEE